MDGPELPPKPGILQRLRRAGAALTGWLAWPAVHPWWAMAVVAALSAASLVAILRLRPDASLEGLFPRGSASGTALLRVLNDFSFAEELLVLVSVPEGDAAHTPATAESNAGTEDLVEFAERLKGAVRADAALNAMASDVMYRPAPEMRQFFERVVVPAGIFYLDDAELAELKRRLTPEAMREQLRRNEEALAVPGPAAGAVAKVVLKDPLRLHEFLIGRLKSAGAAAPGGGSSFADTDPPFLSADGRSLLVRIPGRRPPSDMDFTKAFTAAVARTAALVNTGHLDVRFAGSYAIAAASERAIRSDATSSTTTSFLYLGALFFLAYRFPVRLFGLAFAPVVFGVLVGFGAYAGGSSSISPMTAVLGAMLAEMGINYSVHYLTLYDTHRAGGLAPKDAAASSGRQIAAPLAAAWFTSVVGFLAVGLSSLPVLRGFAALGTSTLAGAVVMTMLLLPAALVLMDRRKGADGHGGGAAALLTRPRFPLEPALGWLCRHGRLLSVLFALCTLVAAAIVAWPGRRLALETDMTVMHPRPNPALDAQAEIGRRFGASPDSLIVYLDASSPDALVALSHDVGRRVAQNVRDAAGAFGLATLLPDPRLTPARAAAFTDADAERVVSDFRAAVADSPFNPAAYEPYAMFLRRLLTCREVPTLDDLRHYPALASLVLPVGAGTPGRSSSVTLVALRRDLGAREAREGAIESARAALGDVSGATLTGMTVVAHDAEAVAARDLPLMLTVGTGLVVAYLLAHFRSARDAALVLVPTAFSILVLVAFMRVTAMGLNMVNLVAAPLLLGINIDYGIFLVSLARDADRRGATAAELAAEIGSSCHAVLVCALTTVLGFGSLVFTAIPAVRSLGVAVSVGVLSCLAATVGFLAPLLLRRRPG